MKQVWVNRATCWLTASTTAGTAWPTLTTAIPDPRSMRALPSTSTRIAPDASLDVEGEGGADAGRHRRRSAPMRALRVRPRAAR